MGAMQRLMTNARSARAVVACLGLGMIATPAGAERCDPPHRTCYEGYQTFPCPPCPPGGGPRLVEAEKFRRALEGYREELEEDRAEAPGNSLERYRKGLGKYQEGIKTYKDTVAVIGKDE
jgi:hypothetical protein